MKKFNEKYYIIVSIITFTILFIVLLGFYPGIVSYDGNNQWQQVKSQLFTNAHPFFSTYFMYILSKIWNSVTIVILYQILLYSIAWGYFCKTLKANNKKQKIIICIFTIIITLNPLTSLYSITLWKDIIYTSYLFISAVMLYEWSNNNYDFKIYKYCFFGIILSMIYSYRHNGIIVSIILLIIFYIICFVNYRRKIISKTSLKKSAIVLISFISLILLISIPKKAFLNKSNENINNQISSSSNYSTIDGYMVWMMGAHLKDNNIKDSKDKDFLNKIIPLDSWKKAYNPYLINNTNLVENFDKNYLSLNRNHFKELFIKYSIRNPLSIVEHYLKSDALLINPVSSINGYVYVYCFPEMADLPEYTKIRSIIKPVRWFYLRLSDFSLKKPFIIFYQPAFIMYLSIFLTIILSKRVLGKKIWLFSLPMILNIVSLLPINLAQDLRYVYINYLTFYGLLLISILNYKLIFRKNNLLIK